MLGVIREGDQHDHGGAVIKGSGIAVVHGKPVALLGDPCSCPIHGPCVIIEGDTSVTSNGTPTAFDQHKTSCGASLASSISSTGKT